MDLVQFWYDDRYWSKVSRISLFLNSVVYLFHFWHDDRCRSKILCGTIPNPVYDFKVKITDLEFLHCNFLQFQFLAHLSRRLTRWAYKIGVEPASVCACVCPLTILNMNISKTRGPIATKFYLKHHWGGGKPALGFGPGRIRTLVSMATDSSHRVIMGKTASPRFLGCFCSDPFHSCR